eukprot:4955814-Pyramimonas_sp.AAC.1
MADLPCHAVQLRISSRFPRPRCCAHEICLWIGAASRSRIAHRRFSSPLSSTPQSQAGQSA